MNGIGLGQGRAQFRFPPYVVVVLIVVLEIMKTWLNFVNLREFATGYIVVTIMQISTIRSENTKYVWLTELIQRSNIHS